MKYIAGGMQFSPGGGLYPEPSAGAAAAAGAAGAGAAGAAAPAAPEPMRFLYLGCPLEFDLLRILHICN